MPARTLFWTCALTFALATAAHAAMTISNAKTKNVTCTSGVCTPTGGNANLRIRDLVKMLASSDVTVKSNASTPDIGVLDALAWTSTHRLTLDAYESIHVRAPVVVEGTAGVTLTTNDGGSGGDYGFNTATSGAITFWDTASSLIIDGKSYVLAKDIKTLASDIVANPSGNYALANDYNAKPDTFDTSPINVTFTGFFQGLGHEITHLTLSLSGIGFFEAVGSGGMVRDIRLKDVDINTVSAGNVGGLIGVLSDGSVLSASVTGSITARGGTVGGLIGQVTSTNLAVVRESYAIVTIRTAGEAGGLVGDFAGTMSESWAAGDISLSAGSAMGGLVGLSTAQRFSSIVNCYAVGSVTARGLQNVRAGGLVGQLQLTALSSSYSTAYVHAGIHATVAGLIGYQDTGSDHNDYWDVTTNGLTQGIGNIYNAPGVTGLTDAQLKSALPAGFDPNVWGQSASINNGWPYLIANPPPQ